MQNLRKAPARTSKPKRLVEPAPPSLLSAQGRGRAVLGLAISASARAKAMAATNAKAASVHVLALTVDHGLIAAGVAAAIGSASFAGFMMARDNSHPLFGGVEHLMIFAQPSAGSGGDRRLGLERAPRSVDYDATGSIDETPLPRSPAAATPRGEEPDGTGVAAKGYVLRFTHAGAVIVDGPKGSYAAAPGVVLPDVGRILAVQNRNGRWVVSTENGVIAEAAQ